IPGVGSNASVSATATGALVTFTGSLAGQTFSLVASGITGGTIAISATNPIPITFNSGTLNFVACNAANTVSSQIVGTITLSSGQSTISSGYSGAAAIGATSA